MNSRVAIGHRTLNRSMVTAHGINLLHLGDNCDAHRLAFFLEKDMLMLTETFMKVKQNEEMKSLTQTQDKFVKRRPVFRNKYINFYVVLHQPEDGMSIEQERSE